MTTEQQEDQSWRRHEVPTFTETRDVWFFGLTLKQILGLMIVAGLAWAFYTFASFSFLTQTGRWVGCGVIVAIGGGVIALRPGGRSVFSLFFELGRYFFGSKEYLDDVLVIVSPQKQGDIDREAAEKAAEAAAAEAEAGGEAVIHSGWRGRLRYAIVFFGNVWGKAFAAVRISGKRTE